MKQNHIMKRSTFTLFLILLSTMQLFAWQQQSIDITVNGQIRNMVVFTPDELPAKSPLFIVTHGMNQNTSMILTRCTN